MRKLVLFFVTGIFSLVSLQLSAQRNAYEIGDKTAGAGITFGYFNYGYYGSRVISLPAIMFSGEYGFHEYVSAGAYLGFVSWKYKYDYLTTYTYKQSIVAGGIRGSFHYLPLLNEYIDLGLDETKFDFYVSLIGGLNIERFKSDDNLNGVVNVDDNVSVSLGSFLGFKYMVTEQIGVFAETGWNALGYLTLGATARF